MQSQAFHLTALGYGRDLVRSWTIKNHDGPFIKPWRKEPIEIYGAELLIFPRGPCHYRWFMVGNADVDDIMLMANGEDRRVANWFPKPFAFAKNYLDLHCSAIGCASVFLNFYYEIEGE